MYQLIHYSITGSISIPLNHEVISLYNYHALLMFWIQEQYAATQKMYESRVQYLTEQNKHLQQKYALITALPAQRNEPFLL